MRVVLNLFLFVTLGLALSAPGVAGSLVYMRVPKPLVEEYAKQAPNSEAGRVSTLRNLFQKAGCPQVAEQPVPNEQSPNLMCILPGIEEGTIVVGASLEYAAESSTSEDAKSPSHWGALAMLPLLAKSLAGVPHRTTLVLVAFPGHAHGMGGAAQYVAQLSDVKRRTMRGMVNLSDLGRTPPVYALAQQDSVLAPWLADAAHSLHLAVPPQVDASKVDPQNGVPALKEVDLWGDAQPFAEAHIPTITVQSAPPAMLAALHKDGSIPERVTGAGFDLDTYDDTYRLLCIYALYLDGNLGRPPIPLGTYTGTLLDTAGAYGTRTVDMTINLDRFSTAAELEKIEMAFRKGGQEGLIDALEKADGVGSYRGGLKLAVGAKLAVLQTSGKTPSVFIVSVRLQIRNANPITDYRFEVIQMSVDAKGNGDARFFDKALQGSKVLHAG